MLEYYMEPFFSYYLKSNFSVNPQFRPLLGWLVDLLLVGWLSVGWLVGLLVGLLACWLVDWLAGWLAVLVGWLIGWLVGWLVGWFVGLLVG